MADIEHNIEVNLRGDLIRRAGRSERALRQFSRNSERNLGKLQRRAKATGRELATIGKGLAKGGLLAGAAGGAAVGFGGFLVSSGIAEAEERFERLGIQASRTSDEMRQLKKDLFEIASRDDIRIDPLQLFNGVQNIVEKTEDLDFAVENAENIALAIQAAGAEGASIGALVAEFKKFGIVTREDVLAGLDLLVNQGKAGSFTLANLAQLGERNVSAYASLGRTGLPALREMGAALQVIRSGVGSSEQATTAFEAVLRTLTDGDKVKQLEKISGIQVFDAAELEKGREVLRPINELLVEIVKASGGKKTELSQIFDAEAVRAFGTITAEFLQSGSVESIERFYAANADGTSLLNDSARAAQITTQQIDGLGASISQITDNITGREGFKEGLEGLNQILKETADLSGEADTSLLDVFQRFDQRVTAGFFRAVGLDGVASRFDGELPALGGNNGSNKVELDINVTTEGGSQATVIRRDNGRPIANTGQLGAGAGSLN